MRKLCMLFGLLLIPSLAAVAQDPPLVEGSVNYSYLRLRDPSLHENFNGWNSSITVNATSWLGIVADGGGYYASPTVSGTDIRARIYSYMFGPRFSYRGKVLTPFAQALFGQARLRVTVPSVPTFSSTDSGFAMTVGVGADVKVAEHVAIRVIQAEWFRTQLSGNTQNNVRLSAGVVFRFGKR